MSLESLNYPAYTPGIGSRPRLQSVHPFRNLMASGTNMNAAWSAGAGGGSGHSGYGAEHPDYDYHSGPPAAHMPSGGSYSYHATADTGYGVPPPAHPPQKGPSGGAKKGGGKKSGGSTAMTALTLLSFFFFVNLLQGCIKDHMDAMNPTVMVMTTNIRRNRFNKMGEMNSREHSSGVSSSSSFSSTAANGANLVMQPADMVAAAANSVASVEAMKPAISLTSPYSGVTASVNKPLENQQQQHQTGSNQPPPPPQVYQANMADTYQKPHYNPQQTDPYQPHNPPQQPQYHAHNQAALPPQQPQYHPHNQAALPPQQHQYYPHSPQTMSYSNQSEHPQLPPIYLSSPVEHEFHNQNPHSDYHYSQRPPSAPPQTSYHQPHSPYADPTQQPHQYFSTPRNPFYEHQYPSASSSQYSQDHRDKPQYSMDNDNDSVYSHKYEMPSVQQNSQSSVPWSSHSASVVSGPFRRASIVAVSPNPKWISVPANINDHTEFDENEEETDRIRMDRYS